MDIVVGTGFEQRLTFSLSIDKFEKNVVIIKVDNSPFVDAQNKRGDILILGKDRAERLDSTLITKETNYSVIITKWRKEICLHEFSLQWKQQLFVW